MRRRAMGNRGGSTGMESASNLLRFAGSRPSSFHQRYRRGKQVSPTGRTGGPNLPAPAAPRNERRAGRKMGNALRANGTSSAPTAPKHGEARSHHGAKLGRANTTGNEWL